MGLSDAPLMKLYSLNDVLELFGPPEKGTKKAKLDALAEVARATGCCVEMGGELHFTESHVLDLLAALSPARTLPSQTDTEASQRPQDRDGWVYMLLDPHLPTLVTVMWAATGEGEDTLRPFERDLQMTITGMFASTEKRWARAKTGIRSMALGGARYQYKGVIRDMFDAAAKGAIDQWWKGDE